jgi:beta-glucosidase-like glycosyl hydrolase
MEGLEPVGVAFSTGLITDLLQNEMEFEGIVVTDWAIVTDTVVGFSLSSAHAFGIEDLTDSE